jgi:hypothetical protein
MRKHVAIWLAVGALSIAASASAADTKTYQVTGPVLEVSSDTITVQKGSEKWEIAKDASTSGPEVKKGDHVTIHYKMTATSIDEKPAAHASHMTHAKTTKK